ncbi:hypothetical protein [Pseudonocardia endophytica]|uniref:CYTH domain-containing protein n=1 Tax=Pseudonocardia endophytica TaxID=401976 RepID=A0A4R1I370_PSEEN|nr:hypothetical protein [Pseudonocardia endophytica]TCK24412.1 hypothetical protein EV378_0184 [Pseudonocardia endophytica]
MPRPTRSWWNDLPEPDRPDEGLPVELKVLLTVDSRRVVHDAADGLLPGRSVHYFDTPRLDLSRRGVVVRLRSVGEHRGDATVKIRRGAPARLPKPLRRHRDLAVEIDTLPDARHWSAALRKEIPADALQDVLRGRRELGDVLSGSQRMLYGALPRGGPDLCRLRRVGPVRVRRLRLATLDCGSRVVAETCRYPDGSRLVEVSAKCPAAMAAVAATEFTALLRALHVDTAPEQRTKTSTALDLLARAR